VLCWLPQMDLTLNIVERKTGGLSAGGGISAQGHADGAMPGFIGSFSYSQRNLFGLNQKLAATVELGQVMWKPVDRCRSVHRPAAASMFC
jgi:outer membrane protein insertion porin family